jgi:phage gpG-like protein
MTPAQFETYLTNLQKQYGQYYDTNAPTIAAKVAVDYFKEGFLQEGWERGRHKWKEVKRRQKTWTRGGDAPASYTLRILTESSDLGKSIEQDDSRTGNGQAVVWTSPSKFTHSNKIYAAVHNEGLRAGRGKGFIMPKRQFMGESSELNTLIIKELERKLKIVTNSAL